MVKYIINDDNIYDVISSYESNISKIRVIVFDDTYYIIDFSKSLGPSQRLWSGYNEDEMKLQLKVERARAAFKSIAEKVLE